MAVAKRIFLFLALNFLVVLTISLILQVLDIAPYLSAYGLNIRALAIFCLIWGMGGALISLALSKKMAQWVMGVKMIDPNTSDPHFRRLHSQVAELAQHAKLAKIPEIGIYPSNEVNAFATGATRKNSLVAVSAGLLNRMDDSEIKAILGHEISHIANGDMVTMTLLQGVINAFVMFLARAIAYGISGFGRNREGSYFSYAMFTFFLEIIFMILGSLVVAAYSRFREYRADEGGAYLAGKEKMISALRSLESLSRIKDTRAQNTSFCSFKISSPTKRGLITLFASHPPISKRIERLQKID